jgi:hypothetical protein
VVDVDQIAAKKEKHGFTQAIASEKSERVARRSLHDIVVFHQAIEADMQRMLEAKANGSGFDTDLFERMAVVQEHYKRVMTGFLELDDNSQRNALITFADTIQDLLKYIHIRRKG